MMFELNNKDVTKIDRKGRNCIADIFNNYMSADDLIDKFFNNSKYTAPHNRIICKAIVKYV